MRISKSRQFVKMTVDNFKYLKASGVCQGRKNVKKDHLDIVCPQLIGSENFYPLKTALLVLKRG